MVFSATLQSGAIYNMYEPDALLIEDLVTKFKMDLPRFMQVFDIQDEKDLPILWMVDFMFGDKDEFGKDTFYVGEDNFSSIGITQQLHLEENVGKIVVDLCFPTSKDDHDNDDNDEIFA